jgi:branched-chain amino acid transport system permease protein
MLLQQAINALVLGSELTLFTLGLSLAWGTLDVLNLAHGAVFVMAGFLAYELTQHGTFAFIPALVIATAGCGVIVALMELTSIRWIRAKSLAKREARLATLVVGVGLANIINQIVVNENSNPTASFGIPTSAFSINRYTVGSLTITNIQIIIILTSVIVAVALDYWVRRSRNGRAVRAVAYDPVTAGLLGINVNRLAAITMFLAGALAGLAGVLLAVNLGGGEDVTIGQTYLLTAFAVVIVGGVGNVRGAVMAAFAIAIAETAVVAYGPSQWRDAIAFLMIMLVLVIRPQGLLARKRFERA